ncbi:RpiB/LacA/LacB family sugar-phosphate isomerase [Streptomyces albus]|uniref:RpiB/LacA/LacB family sugar-phosphate isomerase n=1 Tax=Streptomyces albus TaxID=1888 RepID=UPI0036F5E880
MDALPAWRVAVGCDRAGHDYKQALVTDLRTHAQVSAVLDVNEGLEEETAYPAVALRAARQVAAGEAERALLVCHTGLGMAIAANKVPGVRAVTAHDPLSVCQSVVSNDAQVLALGQGIVGLGTARWLVHEWLRHQFDPGSSAAVKVAAITAAETGLED